MTYKQPKSQWVFTLEEIKRSPSTQAGHDVDRERMDRMKGSDFIVKVGMHLRLPQTTISTACVFLHRFYMRFSLKEFHQFEIGATALFLATKCEETGRKLKDLVVACVKTAQKNMNAIIDEQSKDYWKWRDVILYNEELLLEALCFDFIIDHPYSLLKEYWRTFGGGKETAKIAWACANDTYRTTIPLCFGIDTIAIACLHLASVSADQPLDSAGDKLWFETLEVRLDSVIEVITLLIELYEEAQPLAKDSIDFKALATAGVTAIQVVKDSLATSSTAGNDLQDEPTNGKHSESDTSTKRPATAETNGVAKRIKTQEDVTAESTS